MEDKLLLELKKKSEQWREKINQNKEELNRNIF